MGTEAIVAEFIAQGEIIALGDFLRKEGQAYILRELELQKGHSNGPSELKGTVMAKEVKPFGYNLEGKTLGFTLGKGDMSSKREVFSYFMAWEVKKLIIVSEEGKC